MSSMSILCGVVDGCQYNQYADLFFDYDTDMREHAIFALRYLLAGNAESQSLVGSLQPAQQDASQGGTHIPMV